jgi:phosphatidylserine/phosphatidylglycerophosphate/cardiolipin synthase-like enzyme
MIDGRNSEVQIGRAALRGLVLYVVLCALAITARSCGGRMIPVHAAEAPASTELHYSPAENLEAIDLATLDTAQKTLDISTYAMDDKPIAEELVKLAGRGVVIRVYRDQTQYEGEIARGKKGGTDLNQLFQGQRNIQVRVKGVVALAHLKAYAVDGKLLREGSANWSLQGEKVQDNSLLLIRDRDLVGIFEKDFEVIWNRPSNEAVQ